MNTGRVSSNAKHSVTSVMSQVFGDDHNNGCSIVTGVMFIITLSSIALSTKHAILLALSDISLLDKIVQEGQQLTIYGKSYLFATYSQLLYIYACIRKVNTIHFL